MTSMWRHINAGIYVGGACGYCISIEIRCTEGLTLIDFAHPEPEPNENYHAVERGGK